MTVNRDKVKTIFQQMLREIKPYEKDDFSGIGVILYESKYLDGIPHFALRPSFKCRTDIDLSNAKEYLLEISKTSHTLHDGYHFFNEKGQLTHVAQYLAAPIVKEVKPNELYGARHLTAQLASRLRGVIAVGTISHGGDGCYFENGTYFNVSDPWNKIYEKNGKDYQYFDVNEPHEDMLRIIDHFKKGNVKRVLDLGCGGGRNLLPICEQGFEAYGMDYSKFGIEMAKKMLKAEGQKAALWVGNIFEKLNYEDSYFDAMVSVQVLQHGRENEIKLAISEIKRILKPGGFLFVTLCGRSSNGKVRFCLVKTADKIAPHTYVPTLGNEIGLTHFIYNDELIKKHYGSFKMLKKWKDSKDYYCFLATNQK